MRISLIFIFLLFFGTSYGQDRAYYDSVTYYQFIAKEYKAVLKTGNEALSKEIDFYYLRYRMAFASYENKNFVKSIPHFRAMLQMNPSDTIAQEFLYLSYLETNQEENASICAENFTENLKKKYKIHSSILNQIALNFGMLMNKNDTIKPAPIILLISDSISIPIKKLNGKLQIVDFASKWNISSRTKMNFNISYFRSEVNFLAADPKVSGKEIRNDQKNSNFQGNLIFSFLNKRNWKSSLGLAYFYNQAQIKPYLVAKIGSPPSIELAEDSYHSFLGVIKLEKTGNFYQPSVGLTLAKFYSQMQFQLNIGTNYLPFGNYNLYGGTHLYFNSTNGIDAIQTESQKTLNNLILHQFIGLKITKFAWFETCLFSPLISKSTLQNLSIETGSLTFNSADPIRINAGFDLILKFKNIDLIPSYRFQQRNGTTNFIVPSPNSTVPKGEPTPYNNHVYNLTFKWHL